MDAEERAYADANGTAWCETCRRYVAVADDYDTDTGDTYPTVRAYRARPLYCGHDASGPVEVVGRASDDTQTVEALAAAQTQVRLARAAEWQDQP